MSTPQRHRGQKEVESSGIFRDIARASQGCSKDVEDIEAEGVSALPPRQAGRMANRRMHLDLKKVDRSKTDAPAENERGNKK